MTDFPLTVPEIAAIVNSGQELSLEQYDLLYTYYLENNLMPYGVAKARTGDPYQWIEADLVARLANAAAHATFRNPIQYRDYMIFQSEFGDFRSRFEFQHRDYDGPEDRRAGHAASIGDAMTEIEELL